MKKALPAVLLALSLSNTAIAAAALASTGGGKLIPPPAIYMPYGGKIVSEVNLSDSNVLGIIKQILPALTDLVRVAADAFGTAPVSGKTAVNLEALPDLDFKPLSEVIEGVKNVRFIVVKYPRNADAQKLLAEMDAGVAKVGTFSKVASDFAFVPGVFAMYAQSNKEGYIAFAYDSKKGVLYAGRIVGLVDVAKLTQWISDAMKTITPLKPTKTEQPTKSPDGAPQAVPAQPSK